MKCLKTPENNLKEQPCFTEESVLERENSQIKLKNQLSINLFKKYAQTLAIGFKFLKLMLFRASYRDRVYQIKNDGTSNINLTLETCMFFFFLAVEQNWKNPHTQHSNSIIFIMGKVTPPTLFQRAERQH